MIEFFIFLPEADHFYLPALQACKHSLYQTAKDLHRPQLWEDTPQVQTPGRGGLNTSPSVHNVYTGRAIIMQAFFGGAN